MYNPILVLHAPPKTFYFLHPQEVPSRGCSCSKKYRNFWAELNASLFFFPATIFKNLQPSDFLHCASTHQHGVTEKKRATGWSTTIIALMVTFHANAAVTFSCISRLNRWLNSPWWKRKQQAERIFSPLKSIFWDYFVWKCGSSFAVGREN